MLYPGILGEIHLNPLGLLPHLQNESRNTAYLSERSQEEIG